MKFKNCFVTNSSSVSFIGWGIKIKEYFPAKTWKKIYELVAKSDCYYKNRPFECFILDGHFDDSIYGSIEGTDLTCHLDGDKNIYYVGLEDFQSEEKEKTIQKLKDELKRIGFEDKDMEKIEYINEMWHDG